MAKLAPLARLLILFDKELNGAEAESLHLSFEQEMNQNRDGQGGEPTQQRDVGEEYSGHNILLRLCFSNRGNGGALHPGERRCAFDSSPLPISHIRRSAGCRTHSTASDIRGGIRLLARVALRPSHCPA